MRTRLHVFPVLLAVSVFAGCARSPIVPDGARPDVPRSAGGYTMGGGGRLEQADSTTSQFGDAAETEVCSPEDGRGGHTMGGGGRVEDAICP